MVFILDAHPKGRCKTERRSFLCPHIHAIIISGHGGLNFRGAYVNFEFSFPPYLLISKELSEIGDLRESVHHLLSQYFRKRCHAHSVGR